MSAVLKQVCPSCQAVNDRVTSPTKPDEVIVPEKGDMTVCFSCGTILIFDDKLNLRKPAAVEVVGLHQTEAWDQLKTIQHFVLNRKKS